jgi:hypothetical protein
MVFHRVRFPASINGTNAPFPGPRTAEAWRFYPNSPLDPNGVQTFTSDEWGGFGLYGTRAAAEAVYEKPEDHLGFLGETVEAYHALVVPYAHRGKVNWRGPLLENETLRIAPLDPGGPLMVFTSAGYDNPGPNDEDRMLNFFREVERVVEFYATLPGNLRRAVFSGNGVDRHSGMTVSIWTDDKAMMTAAYRPGHHKAQMDYQREVGHFDYSSFSRARILKSKGSWDGADPVSEIGVPA